MPAQNSPTDAGFVLRGVVYSMKDGEQVIATGYLPEFHDRCFEVGQASSNPAGCPVLAEFIGKTRVVSTGVGPVPIELVDHMRLDGYFVFYEK